MNCTNCGTELESSAKFCSKCGQKVIVETNPVPEQKGSKHPTENKKKGFAAYIIAGSIWALAQNFKKSTIDELLILTIAIGAGFLYYRLKSKIKIKNETWKVLLTLVILFTAAAFLIGFSTALADRWEEIAVRTPLGTEIAAKDNSLLIELTQNQKVLFADIQTRWDKAQEKINDDTESRIGYGNNVAGYSVLIELNNERWGKFTEYSDKVLPILSKYSHELRDAFSQLVTATGKTKDAYNEVFTAKINYYQALLDGKENGISVLEFIVRNKVEKFNQTTKEALQAQDNWQKAYSDFAGS